MIIAIHGATRVAAQLRAAAGWPLSGAARIGQVLYQEAEKIMAVSKANYVPVDTGALRASGFVEPPVQTATGASVTLGFGGPAAPYAVIVHEDLTKRHPVGEAKYLETPLKAALLGMPQVLTHRANMAIKQAIQRLGNAEANVRAGRDPYFGMPLFRGAA